MMAIEPLVPHLKALHIAALAIWVAALFAIPAMLARHDPAIGQDDYARIRRATHFSYTALMTPAAVIAVASGTLLIFLRGAFFPWLMAKLVLVAMMVVFHAWLGHTLVKVAETEGEHDPPEPLLPSLILTVLVAGVLGLVLAKPELDEIAMPDWLTEPRGGQLPFAVPRR